MKKLKQIIFVLGLVLVMGGNASAEVFHKDGLPHRLSYYISKCAYLEIITAISKDKNYPDDAVREAILPYYNKADLEPIFDLSKQGNGEASYLAGLVWAMDSDFDKAMKYFKLSTEQKFLTGYDEIIPCLELIISDHTSATGITKKGKIAKVELEKIKKISEKERQKEFLNIVKIHAEKYKNAKNQIKKSFYRKKRMKAFSEFFSKSSCFEYWVGTVKSLVTDKNGDAILKIDIGGFKYQNYGSEAIPMSDTLFDTVAEMEENDKVVLSGCFSKHNDAFADNWYLFTHEHTENGAMTSPTFQGEYLDIKKIN